MTCYSPLKGYRDEVTGGLCFDRQLDSRGGSLVTSEMEVGCGQCIGCRLDRSRMWTARITHEAQLYEFSYGNCFITLTYDDEHLPSDWSLRKRDFQLFMKRLRKQYEQRIRFFHCGEYGNVCRHIKHVNECDFCTVGRPHYHAILFNVQFEDAEVVCVKNGYRQMESERLNKIWGHGFAHIGSVTAESAGYVARYCLKKITGINAQVHYESFDTGTGEVIMLQPEYATMSRRPGIGADWFDQYVGDVFPSDEVPIPGKGVQKGVPRYYDDLYGRRDPDGLEAVKKSRIQFRNAHAGEYVSDRLMSKATVKMAQLKFLKREI